MTRTRWIVFIVLCAIVLGGLAFTSKQDTVDVSKTDVGKIIAESDTAIGDHVYGNKDAKVALVEYGDFQCPACSAAYPNIKSIKETYKKNIAFVFRNFPLTALHPNALAASAAAESAGLQGKFWEMHNVLYENQDGWSGATADQRDDLFAGYAKEIGLNIDQYRTDLTSKKVTDKISRDQALGRKLKVDATPSLALGDEKLEAETVSDLVQASGEKLVSKLDTAIRESGGTVPKRTGE